jgi:restriction system protein
MFYEVQLTPETRDGGFDLSAVRKSETNVRLLIECKRYVPPHKVGRPVVQQVYGVLTERQTEATKAIVATTSTFTADARAFLAANCWRIEGRDRSGLLEWIAMARGKGF